MNKPKLKKREYLIPINYTSLDYKLFTDVINAAITDYLGLINNELVKGVITHYYGLNNSDKYNLSQLSKLLFRR